MTRPKSSTSSLNDDDGDGDDPGSDTGRAEAVSAQEGLVGGSLSTSTPDNIASSPQPTRTSLHRQKRRRVTRACDECRRKKIKCDGKQPCTHCTVYSYECTYDQPSHRRRNSAPQYIEALERRLQRAETVLRTVLPNVNLDDPNLVAAVRQRADVSLPEEKSPDEGPTRVEVSSLHPGEVEVEQESLLESMVDKTGSLDLDDEGYWGFHGHSSGLIFLRRIRKHFGDLIAQPKGSSLPTLSASLPPLTTRNLAPAFDSPKSDGDSPDCTLPNLHDLPTQETTRGLCEHALNDACASFPFIHKPTFYHMVDRIYHCPPENFGNEENRFLPLLYATMALGCLFTNAEQSMLQLQGFQWLKSSRQLMEITDCRDLTSLQTILVMIFFLQSSARLSTCYSHIGIAVTSSLRMGLHRSVPATFNPIEHEMRKRIFWTVRKMDVYVGVLLGLPEMLSDDHIDQEMPLEVDDEFITVNQILPMPPGQISSMIAFNAHTRLLYILAKIVKYIYPVKGLAHTSNQSDQSYVVNHAQIREIEQDLHEWMEKLPHVLRPGFDSPPQLVRIQQNLRIAYVHLQMLLYRPFLHYASSNWQPKNIDQRSYACAAACVGVSRNIVQITVDMNRRGLLIGWFYMYTTFFAIMALVFFVLENPSNSMTADILRDASQGKDILAGLAKRSMAADRCSVTLTSLFEQLPKRFNEAGIPIFSPTRRNAWLNDNWNELTTTFGAAETSFRPAYKSRDSPRSQPSISPQHPNSKGEYSLSAPHRVSTSDHDANKGITDGYIRSGADHYFGCTEAIEPPTMLSLPSQSQSDVSQPFLTTPPNFLSGGFAGASAMMFPSADPFMYPTQPMSSVEYNGSIKPEDHQDPRWSDNLSSGIGSGIPHIPVYATYSPYSMPSHGVGVEAQYIHVSPEINLQNYPGHVPVPNKGNLQVPSDIPPPIHPHDQAATEWSRDWSHHGY